MVVLETPTRARLLGFEPLRKDLEQALAYVDGRLDYELGKTQASLRSFKKPFLQDKLVAKWGQAKYEEVVAELAAKVARLKVERKKTLLFEDGQGLWTYAGLAPRLAKAAGVGVRAAYALDLPRALPWAHEPRHANRFYQEEALDALLASAGAGPRGVELPTGAGKSTVIRCLLKHFGLPAVVMAPSTSIAHQLYDDLVHHFGKRYVGLYGDGKKDYDKLLVVGIDDSLGRVEEGSAAWEALSRCAVFVADESHLTPAASLQKVCLGLLAGAPYRFFVSATQMRNDGLDLVLDGITGPIVYRKSLRELVDAGFLARPSFKMVRVPGAGAYSTKDPGRMTRAHLYYNKHVVRTAAELANNFVALMRRPTLILVEELEQFRELLPHLKHEVRFAHGPLGKDTKALVPSQYHDDKPKELVAAFNEGRVPILVGTSCISMGTDVQVAEAGIYLMGQTSKIKLLQAVGRETRGGFKGSVVNPWTGKQKLDCVHVDFRVDGVPLLERHADEREAIYTELYAAPDHIDMSNNGAKL